MQDNPAVNRTLRNKGTLNGWFFDTDGRLNRGRFRCNHDADNRVTGFCRRNEVRLNIQT